jgi:hypothetical protein
MSAGGLKQRRQFLEGAAERAAGTRGVLQEQRAAVGLCQRLGDHLARAPDRFADVAGLGRPGVQHDAHGADSLTDGERLHERGQ